MNEKKLHYGWIVIFMGFLTTIAAHGFGRMSFTAIYSSMQKGLMFNNFQMGLLGSGNFIGYLTMAIIGGFLSARFGTRIVITFALILMGVTMILTGLAQSFGFAFTMRLFTGLGNGASYVPAMALGSAWFAMKKRGLATGLVAAGIGAGTLISSRLVIPPILTTFGPDGWRFTWYILGAAVVIVAGFVYMFVRNRPEERGLQQVGANLEEIDSNDLAETKRVSSLQWTEVIRTGSVWYLGLVYFFYGLSYVIYMIFFAAHLVDMGFTQEWASALWGWVGAISIFCGVIWGGISDRIGRSRGAALAYLVLGLSYIIYAVVKIKFGFYLSAVMFGLTAWSIPTVMFGLTAWSIPTIMAAAAGDFVGPRLAPAGLGFITLFFGIGQFLGPALGGYLADVSRSFTFPFLVAGGISLIGMISALYLKKPAA
jgi:sugar phosphate permease